MGEQAMKNAVGYRAMGVKRACAPNRRASSRIAHWLAAFRGALAAPRQQAVCGDVVVHAEVASSRFRGGYP